MKQENQKNTQPQWGHSLKLDREYNNTGVLIVIFICLLLCTVHACPSHLHTVHLCYHWHATFETNSPGDDQRKSHCMAQY